MLVGSSIDERVRGMSGVKVYISWLDAPILTRQQEFKLGRELFSARERMFSTPFIYAPIPAYERLFDFESSLRAGEVNLGDILYYPSSERREQFCECVQKLKRLYGRLVKSRGTNGKNYLYGAIEKGVGLVVGLDININVIRSVINSLVEDCNVDGIAKNVLADDIDEFDMLKARLVDSNLRLVLRIVRRFYNTRILFADLVQAGNLGLMVAAERYDYRKNVKFSSYASWWIKSYIKATIAEECGSTKMSRNDRDKSFRLRKIRGYLPSKLGREASLDDVADVVGLPSERAASLIDTDSEFISFDDTVLDDIRRGDLLKYTNASSVTDAISSGELGAAVDSAIQALTPRERDVIKKRLGLHDGDEWELKRIGNEYGTSRQRIEQIQKRALKKLAGNRRLKELRDSL